jgi:hypothetical protein
MGEFMQEIVTAALTAFFGVVVFVVGQWVQRFVLEPVQEQRKVLGEIAYALLMFGNVGHVAEIRARGLPVLDLEEPIDVVRTVRALASRLQQTLYVIPGYRFLAWCGLVPRREVALAAIPHLIGWSNSIHSGNVATARDEVARILGMSHDQPVAKANGAPTRPALSFNRGSVGEWWARLRQRQKESRAKLAG